MENGPFWIIITGLLTYAGGLFSTYFAQRLQTSKDKQLILDDRELHAQYLAIRVVCKLDPFVSKCCEVVDDNGLEDQKGETVPMVEEPTLSFPEDVDWKSVPPDLMYRILGFPNELENARLHVALSNEIASSPDYSEFFEARTIAYGQLGLTALALADEIREKYKIPKHEFGNHNPKSALERAVKTAKEERDATRAQNDKLMDELREKLVKREQPTTPKDS